jgi:hypothetical protein
VSYKKILQMPSSNLSSLEILAAVATQCVQEEKLLTKPKPIDVTSEHGSAWTYNDNIVLWQAYEKWEQQPRDPEIAQWKQQPRLPDYSFPYYVHQRHFASRRTLVGVRKHFFKLKQCNFGKVYREHMARERQRITIAIPKTVFEGSSGSAAQCVDCASCCENDSTDDSVESAASIFSRQASKRHKAAPIDDDTE